MPRDGTRSVTLEMKLSEGSSYLIQKVSSCDQHLPAYYTLFPSSFSFPKISFFPRATGRLTGLDPTDEIFWNVPDAIVLLYVTSPTEKLALVAVVSRQFPFFSHYRCCYTTLSLTD